MTHESLAKKWEFKSPSDPYPTKVGFKIPFSAITWTCLLLLLRIYFKPGLSTFWILFPIGTALLFQLIGVIVIKVFNSGVLPLVVTLGKEMKTALELWKNYYELLDSSYSDPNEIDNAFQRAKATTTNVLNKLKEQTSK